jgi:Carboxypeptidase regulatory-like domain
MRENLRRAGLTLFAFTFVFVAAQQTQARGGGTIRRLGTISGTVRDQHGQPLAGALVQLLRDGAKEIVKQTRSNTDGSFSTRIAPGRYVLSAIADGFSSVTFTAVQVNPSDELIYRFNLVPLGQGRTAPERRADRNDPKWRLRAAQANRSIFQQNEDRDSTVAAVEDEIAAEQARATEAADTADGELLSASENGRWPVHGVVETFVAASADPLAPAYAGTNFAFVAPASDSVELVFAGQFGTNSLARLETTGHVRAGNKHRLSATLGGASLPLLIRSDANGQKTLQQVSGRVVDEWVVRDGVVVVLGLDYSRFLGPQGSGAFSPRFGFELAADARTRLRFGYTPGDSASGAQSAVNLSEESTVVFPEADKQAVAFVDGRAVTERSRRLEFGVERVLDNKSSIEATAFYDTTDGRGVGLLTMPLNAFNDQQGATLLRVADQQGAARGLRVVYTRRLSKFLQASAGYAVGRGQALAPNAAQVSTAPTQLFRNGFFQTVVAQLDSSIGDTTHVRTVLRFSPRAAVFAIDPFAGRLAVFDPSLSILVTQDLPTFGLPVRAEAVLDARNLLDTQCGVEEGDKLTFIGNTRRSVRGGISVRF